jgi:hypothetical protein
MLRRRLLGVGMAAVICATTLGVMNTTHAHASGPYQEVCTTSGTWTFNPPLNLNPFGSGTVTVTQSGNCVNPDTLASRPAASTGYFSYSGGCAYATLSTSTGSGELVGGSVFVGEFADAAQTNYLEAVLTNPQPAVCDEATASFSGAVTVEDHNF